MAPALAALPSGSTVLVTGANGFVASHICDQLLAHGFVVRGTVRSADKGEAIKRALDGRRRQQHDKGHADDNSNQSFSYAIVEDINAEGAFDDVLTGCVGVIHTASDTTFGADPAIISRQVGGVNNILEAASKTESVRRFVLTSSSNVLTPRPGTAGTVTDKSWNDEAVLRASNLSEVPEHLRGSIVYAAAKTSSERAAWNFVTTRKPAFELNCVNPNFNIGLLLDPTARSSTGGWVRSVFRDPNAPASMLGVLRAFVPQYMVDVQDVAKLHLAALAEEDVKGERLLAFADPFAFNSLMDTFRKLDPGREWPENLPDQVPDGRTIVRERSRELLRRFGQSDFTSLEDSVRNCVYS